MTNRTEIAKGDTLFPTLRKRIPWMLEGAPSKMDKDGWAASLLDAINENPKLQECSLQSLLIAGRAAATQGLRLGGIAKEAFIIPYKTDATLVPGYKGLLALAERGGTLAAPIQCRVVREGETFDVTCGDEERIVHKPNYGKNRLSHAVTHVYVIAKLKAGGAIREVWTTEQIDAHKVLHSPSCGKRDSPWKTHWEAMAKKTVLRSVLLSGQIKLYEDGMSLVKNETTVSDIVADVDISRPEALPESRRADPQEAIPTAIASGAPEPPADASSPAELEEPPDDHVPREVQEFSKDGLPK